MQFVDFKSAHDSVDGRKLLNVQKEFQLQCKVIVLREATFTRDLNVSYS